MVNDCTCMACVFHEYPHPRVSLPPAVTIMPPQVRELFKENVFLSKDPMNRMTLIDSTLPKAVKADKILRDLRREKREATADEQALIDEVEACREIIIQVGFSFLAPAPSFRFRFRFVSFARPFLWVVIVLIVSWAFCIRWRSVFLFEIKNNSKITVGRVASKLVQDLFFSCSLRTTSVATVYELDAQSRHQNPIVMRGTWYIQHKHQY